MNLFRGSLLGLLRSGRSCTGAIPHKAHDTLTQMALPRMNVIAATPGAAPLREIVGLVAKRGPVVITAFSPGRLRAAREVLGESAADYLEFGQLVGHFLALSEALAGGLPGRGHLQAAVSLACEAVEDGPYAPAATTQGFQTRTIAMLDRLRGFGLEADQLDDLASKAAEPLSGKLRTLATIQRESAHSLALLGKHFNSERVRTCLELAPAASVPDRVIVLCGSHDDPVDLSWVKWAADCGVDVTAVVDDHPSNREVFPGAKVAAASLGEQPKPLHLPNELTGRLFSDQETPGSRRPLDVEVWAMPDPLGECEWTLRAICEQLASGVEPGAIAIVARRMEEYAPILEAAARRLGVTLSVARSMPLLGAGIARFLLELLEALASREPSQLRIALRSSYFGLDFAGRAGVELVFREARRDLTEPWRALETLAKGAADAPAWLGELLAWRTEALREPTSLAAWSDRLRDLGTLPWLARAFEGSGPTRDRDQYAMNVLQRSLAEMAAIDKIHDRKPMTLQALVRRCRVRWEREQVSLPRGVGGVAVVASAEEIGPADIVYVLGMLEGVFPRRRTEDPILFDDELAWISDQIGHRIPDSRRRAAEERDEFFRVCSAPSQRLVFSYPLAAEDRDNVRAFYLSEVERLMGIGESVRSRRTWVPEVPIAEADIRLAEALGAPREDPLPIKLESEQAAVKVRRVQGESYSLADLSRVLACPFRFLASNRLELRAHRPQSRWNRLLDLPKQVSLPAQPDHLTAIARMTERLDELVDDMAGETTPEDLAMMRLGGRRLISEWVAREFEARERWGRGQAYPGVSFEEGLRSRFKTRDGQTLELSGKFAGMSEISDHKVINLFMAHDPVAEADADNVHEKLRESDRFEMGMVLAAIPPAKAGVGLEVDVLGQQRRLFLTPRPTPPPSVTANLKLTTFDEEERRDWIRFVEEQVRIALRRLSEPDVEARPGDETCRFCDTGELCRRAHDFGEIPDPFVDGEDEGDR